MSITDSEDSSDNSSLSHPREWLERHGDALYGYALRCVRERSIAEDLVQDTLLAALRGRESFSGASNEQTWLIGILKYKVVDHYRKTARETELAEPDLIAGYDDQDFVTSGAEAGNWQTARRPAAWSIDSNDPVEQQQFWDHLDRCLDHLDPDVARAYMLRDFQEIDYQIVCNVLAVTPTNLRVMLHRARKLLRRCLETSWLGG